MDSRERTFLALEHQSGDRIPFDFWASRQMIAKLETRLGISYEQFLDDHDVDLRYIEGPRYIGPELAAGMDIWGVKRTSVEVRLSDGKEIYNELAHSPLAEAQTVDDVENYDGWPSVDSFDYSVIEAQCDAVADRGRVVVFMGDRLNRIAQLKPMMYIRGIENTFFDLAVREDIARAIIDRIKGFYLAYAERILEAANGKIDIVLTGDDFGAQNGMLISPRTWRDLIKPGFRQYIDLIKAHNVKVMHHTCGSVRLIIDDLIECGLDVLQSIQPEAADMSLADLKAEFGSRLCSQGGISIQKTMPFDTPEGIRQTVKHIAEIIDGDGGYIFCTAHNIQADTPVGNVLTLLEAYKQYGTF
ncbi:MAG: hypothetical protein J7M14_04730 [Planctomycetes bacterium]|nr:hypothetical protein [Planctomycetota bacterium]